MLSVVSLPTPYHCCWLREAVHASRGINRNWRSKFRRKPTLARGQQLPFIQLHPGTLSLLYLSCLNSAYAPFFIPQSQMITALQAWRIKGSKGHKLIMANFLPERNSGKMGNMWWWDRYQVDYTLTGLKKPLPNLKDHLKQACWQVGWRIFFFPRTGKSWIHQRTSTGALLKKIIIFSSHRWDIGTMMVPHVPVPQHIDLFVCVRPEPRKYPNSIQASCKLLRRATPQNKTRNMPFTFPRDTRAQKKCYLLWRWTQKKYPGGLNHLQEK